MKTNNELYLKCECQCGIFHINRIIDKIDNHHDYEQYELSIFKRTPEHLKVSWKNRFRWIWKILTTGEVWTDYILLNRENAVKLDQYLNSHLWCNGEDHSDIEINFNDQNQLEFEF